MALSQSQADTATVFHAEIRYERGGRYPVPVSCATPGYDAAGHSLRASRNGRTQRWKREPERFSIPVKFGLRDAFRIENADAAHWHTAEDCPAAGRE